MECLKLNQIQPTDDFSAVNAEDFFIEDLLNFPTDDGFLEEIDNSQVAKITSPVKIVNDVKTTIPETELCLPENDDSDLEWVSQFVDDSFSGNYSSLTCPAQKFPVTNTVTLVTVNPSFQNLVHKKARSKRCRSGGRVWSLRSPSPLPEYSTSCSSSSSSYTSNPLLAVVESLGKPPVQKQFKKKPAAAGRRCNHCFVQKTPQWRTGPLGAKTLCNACGVRFKSGRLLPEYRPACSPTFSGAVHSNNHRKVLEMRRKKEEAP